MAILESMWLAFKEIISSSFKDLSIWWYLAPILILWIILEVYFGKYKKEKLGWNTSLANGITLTWINIEAMRFLFSTHPKPFWTRFFIVLLIMFYGLFVIYISFTHKFSGKVTYSFAAPSPIYFLAAITTLWGHGVLDISFWVAVDLIVMFPLILAIFAILKKILPKAKKAEEGFEEKPFEEESFGLGKEEKPGKFKF
ncbi:hypothetical protein KY331_06340 [Candidatus Woesearchaeota archaeon]|nr:hypothetical protein [Candidatus Woesearchaeota archaeon]